MSMEESNSLDSPIVGTNLVNANDLALELVANMNQITLDKIGEMGLKNCTSNKINFPKGKSIAELRSRQVGEGESAIVIAAGPSIARKDPIQEIKRSGYNGAIVATDSAMYYCLRNGVVPDLVVTVDPNFLRVVRWFGQPDLDDNELARDDYFRRQDMDASFAEEMRVNHEIITLLKEFGPLLKVALATSASAPVVQRVLDVGMQIYWWNPMFDDPDLPGSETRKLIKANGFPCINAGGNVGTACYMMCHAVLGKKHVAVTGMDFSYYSDTPYRNTQYYYDAINLVGEDKLRSIFIDVHNPYLKKDFYTDPAYYWFKEAFLELAEDADCSTYNCTEGGILFGENINFLPIKEFLSYHVSK
jgi:hypothetical protein